jgi:hypothetical protein
MGFFVAKFGDKFLMQWIVTLVENFQPNAHIVMPVHAMHVSFRVDRTFDKPPDAHEKDGEEKMRIAGGEKRKVKDEHKYTRTQAHRRSIACLALLRHQVTIVLLPLTLSPSYLIFNSFCVWGGGRVSE